MLDGELIRQSEWPDHPRNPFSTADRALMPWSYHRVLAARETPLGAPGDWCDPRLARHDVSVHAWLGRLGLGERAIALGYGMNVGFGDNARAVSALLLFFRASFSAAQARAASAGVSGYTARQGVQRIPEAMAEALPHEVRCNRRVTAIAHDRAGAEVHCAGGAVFRTRHVVCALPFSVLRGVPIEPPLQGRQADAVRALPAQPVTQLYLVPRSRFWEGDGYPPSMFTDGPAGMVAAARSGEDPATVTSFTAWVMGRNARRLDQLPEAAAGRAVLDAIEAIRPAARGQLEFAGLQSWGRSPHARGGWSYFRPGQITRLASEMGKPHGPIRFCGEHLARDNRGMEGAMESGERAAREILSA